MLVTDGQDATVKSEWRSATDAVGAAGVPIFVIGLQDSGFPSRARSTLGRLADASGGRGYFLGDISMLQMTLDYVAELVNGSYALQFGNPAAGSGVPQTVKVEVATSSWKAHVPEKVR